MAQRQFRSDDTDNWLYGFGDGSDGALTISASATEAPIDSACTGTATQTSLSATNASFAANQAILIHQTRGTGAGNWELNKISSYTAGTITLVHPLVNSYISGAQVRVLKQYTSVTINTGQTYTAKAWNGTVGGILGFLCSGTFEIQGTGKIACNGINGAANLVPGNGIGFRGGNNVALYCGEGTAGDRAQQTAKNGNGGGGSGNDQTGGGGGNGTAGSNGTVGIGGDAVGTASLVTMDFGGGGGGGGASGTQLVGGGGGGGIILAIASTITLSGSGVTTLNGGNGSVSTSGNVGSSGGAGGSCLLKGKVISLGTNLITATGGVYGNANMYDGANGGVGRIHIDYKTSLTGTTNPTLDSTQDATLEYVSATKVIFID